MKARGIDISSYNNVKNYEAVAAGGIQFAILKVIRKDLRPDTRFETHWSGFESAGVPIQGVYNYSYAVSTAKFKEDAQRVLSVLAGRKTMVWLDIEDKSLQGLGMTLIDGIRIYAETIQAAGIPFGIYTYQAFYNGFLAPYKDSLSYPFWVARYPSSASMTPDQDPNASKCPDIGHELYGWQYSSRGAVNGIEGFVDLDEWYVDIEAGGTGNVTDNYITDGYRRDMAGVLGLPPSASATDILAKTVTVSAKVNRYHPTITCLERLLKEHGYYAGVIEADQGKSPVFGSGMTKATALYQSKIAGLSRPDSEWTAGNRSYKAALRIL